MVFKVLTYSEPFHILSDSHSIVFLRQLSSSQQPSAVRWQNVGVVQGAQRVQSHRGAS